METLAAADSADTLMELMKDVNILDSLSAEWPERNPRLLTTMVLIAQWPEEVALNKGSPLSLMAQEALGNIGDQEVYDNFVKDFNKWRRLDICTMQSELDRAREVVIDTMGQTPPDKDWASEWERGSHLQLDLLKVAHDFLDKCKKNSPS